MISFRGIKQQIPFTVPSLGAGETYDILQETTNIVTALAEHYRGSLSGFDKTYGEVDEVADSGVTLWAPEGAAFNCKQVYGDYTYVFDSITHVLSQYLTATYGSADAVSTLSLSAGKYAYIYDGKLYYVNTTQVVMYTLDADLVENSTADTEVLTISAKSSSPFRIRVDATSLYVLDGITFIEHVYTLGAADDFSASVFDESVQKAVLYDIAVYRDNMYFLDCWSGDILQFAYNKNTGLPVSDPVLGTLHIGGNPSKIVIKDDVLYVMDADTATITTYILDEDDVSDSVYASDDLDVSATVASPNVFCFLDDDTLLVCSDDGNIYQYTVGATFAASVYATKTKDISSTIAVISGMYVQDDFLIIANYTDAKLYQFTFETAGDISTLTDDSTELNVTTDTDVTYLNGVTKHGERVYIIDADNWSIYEFSIASTYAAGLADFVTNVVAAGLLKGLAYSIYSATANMKVKLNDRAVWDYMISNEFDIGETVDPIKSIVTDVTGATGFLIIEKV